SSLPDCGARSLWFQLTNYLYEFRAIVTLEAVRSVTGQQHIQHHAERVDIADSGNRVSANLFGTRVGGSQRRESGHCHIQRRSSEFRVHHFCNAEIEKLWSAVGGYQDVVRFDVAMNDQVLMRVLDRRADRSK